jgi:putative ABC transport system ATP-binding protein
MLRVSDLVAGYRGRAVARLPALSLAGGQSALLVGPSGSGKTTLLLAIAGLARVFGGEVEVDGVKPPSLPDAERDRFRGRTIGVVFQDLHLIAGLSLLDNVLLAPFAAHARQDRARALSLLQALSLGDVAHRPAEKLSRGQAQRAAIVRAMLMRPKLILADEPTSSLDDEACAAVVDLLERAVEETGAALLIATHDARLKARIPNAVSAEPAR